MRTFEASRPEREQFGPKIIEGQSIAFALADMKTEIDCSCGVRHG